MLKHLIHEKINEIFLEYQKANNITSGDIQPFDAMRLEHIEEALEELIVRVCEYQKEELKMAKYNITVAQRFYGEIEVEANNREEAKSKALDEENLDKIKWFDNKQYQIAEVTKLD